MKWSHKLSCPIKTGIERLFSEESVAYLNEIILLTKAQIVVTSNWRLQLTIDELNEIFTERGVIGRVASKTTTNFVRKNSPLILGVRGLEIREWLDTHYCTDYVVIDDQINDIVDYIPKAKIVKVNPQLGLSSDNVDKAVNVLL